MAHLFLDSKSPILTIKHTGPDDYLSLNKKTLSTNLPIKALGTRVVYFKSFVVDQPDAPILGTKLQISKVLNKDLPIVTGYLFEKEDHDKWWTLIGNPAQFDDRFNLLNSNGSAGTNARTNCKETMSEIVFLHGKIQEDSAIEILKTYPDSSTIKMIDVYDPNYYKNAIAQYNAFESFLGSKSRTNYVAERRSAMSKYNYRFYKAVKKYISNYDNWNPGDVWMFDKEYLDYEFLNDLQTIDQASNDESVVKAVNSIIAYRLNKKEIIPISLKQGNEQNYIVKKISFRDKAFLESYSANNYKLQSIALSKSFSNCTLLTQCGFRVRIGRKGSEASKSLAFEGSMKGAGYQLGAIDKVVIKQLFGIIDGKSVGSTYFEDNVHDQQLLKSIITKIFALSKNCVNCATKTYSGQKGIQFFVDNYNQLDVRQKQYGYIMLNALDQIIQNWTDDQKIEEDFKMMHMLAEKVGPNTCDYIKIGT